MRADAMKASEWKTTVQPQKMAPKPPKIGAITSKSPKTVCGHPKAAEDKGNPGGKRRRWQ
jgi:hypothetical protein